MGGPRSIQGRLLALVVGGVAAVWLAAAAWTWSDVRREVDELLDAHLAQAAALLVVQQAGEIDDGDGPGVDAPVLHRYAPRVAFQVFHEGRLARRSANIGTEPMVAGPVPAADGLHTVRLDGVDWRVFAAHGAERDVRVYVGEQVASRNAILRAVLRGTLAPLALALPLLALATWWAVRFGVAPLRRLGRLLAERRPQALEPVVLRSAPTEMTPMLDALNGLFQRIGELLAAERRFTADAAHELRTPIAAIRAQAQVALGEADDARRRHALQATLAGCDRAARLVEQLLTLARAEAGATPDFVVLDLGAIAQRVLANAAPAAIARDQSLELLLDPEPDTRPTPGPPPIVPIEGDPTLLAVLLRNLVDNAIRYSPRGATLRVRLTQDAAGTRLVVEDSGPGLSDADRARWGERFFRVLGSEQDGSGLGGSIVRRIAAAHGATVAITRSPTLGGLSVEITWSTKPAAG